VAAAAALIVEDPAVDEVIDIQTKSIPR